MRAFRKLLGVLAPAAFAVAFLVQPAAATDSSLQSVSLSAVTVAGAQPLPDVEFTVTSIGSTAPVQVKALSDQGPVAVEVPAGRYKVMASYGHTTAEQEITVGNGPSSHEVQLNAGTIFLKLIHHVGGPTIKSDLGWEILTYGRDAEGKRHLVATSKQSQPKFVLPEGYYLARAVRSTRDVKHTIEVTSGVTYKYTVILQ